MRRFVFRLARLERLREVRRKQTRAALANALAELRTSRERTAATRERLRLAWTERLPEASASEPSVWKQLAVWRDGLRTELRACEQAERESEARAAGAVEQHDRAARAHRVIERLREKRHARWRDDAEVEERKFLDETHLMRLAGSGSSNPLAKEDERCDR